MVLDRYVLLAAEAAAHQLVDHMDLFDGPAEHQGALVSRVVGALVGGIDQRLLLLPVYDADGALRLQERMLRIGSVIDLLHHMGGTSDGFVRIAPLQVLVGQDISLGMDQGRALLHGFQGIEHPGELFIFYLDQLLGFLQDRQGVGCHQSHRVPQIVGDAADRDHGIPVLL